MSTLQYCALCGINEATTKDHIPPKGIYPRSSRATMNLHTVPACEECNNRASVEDEEFKIVMGFLTGEYRSERPDLIDAMARTIGHNQRIANQVFSTSRRLYAPLHSRLVEPAVAVTFPFENYSKVIARIVRGLHWTHTGRSLTIDAAINVHPAQQLSPSSLRALQRLMNCLAPTYLNQDSFGYKVYFADDISSIWALQFFKRHTVFAYAKDSPANPNMERERPPK